MKLLTLFVLFILLLSCGVFGASSSKSKMGVVFVDVDEVDLGDDVQVFLTPNGGGFYRNVYLCKEGGSGYRQPCGVGNQYTGVYSAASKYWRVFKPTEFFFNVPQQLVEGEYFFAVYDYSSRSYVNSKSFDVNALSFPTTVSCSRSKSFFHRGACQPSYCSINGMEPDSFRNCYHRSWSYSYEYCVDSFVSECEVGASCPARFWNKYAQVSVGDCSQNRDSDLGNRKHEMGITTGFDVNGDYVDHVDFCINDTYVMEGVINDCVVELVPVECPVGCDSEFGACVGSVPSSWPETSGSEVVECD